MQEAANLAPGPRLKERGSAPHVTGRKCQCLDGVRAV
jgi:hypothetical protein